MKINLHQKLSLHYLGTLVTEHPNKLFDLEGCQQHVKKVLKDNDVENLGEVSHQFHNKSFSLIIALAESHISIHTWPERHTVQLDVFICNYMHDNSHKCKVVFDEIIEFFEPQEVNTTVIERP